MVEILISNSKEDFIKSLQENVPQPFRIGDTRFFIIKKGNAIHAFERMCPHSGYSLESAVVNPFDELVCPWHGYQYNLKTGEESMKRCRNLILFPVYEKDHGLYMTIPGQTIV